MSSFIKYFKEYYKGGLGMDKDTLYIVSITWQDGEVSIANVTSTQFSWIFDTKNVQNPQYAHPQSTATNSPKTANSQAASQKPAGTSVQNHATPKAAKDAEKKFFSMMGKFFLLVGLIGAALISLVSFALHGKIYVFNGGALTTMAWIVCFLFIIIGIVGALGASGKEKTSMAVACAVIGIVILCVLFAVGNFFSGIFDGVFGGDGKWDTCHKCGGDGRVENSLGIEVECPQCDGVGFIP